MADATRPHAVLIDAETAATVEPIFNLMFDSVAEVKGVEWVRDRLPIACRAVFTIEGADGAVLATVTIQGPVESLELEH